jgi:hypothetical protein
LLGNETTAHRRLFLLDRRIGYLVGGIHCLNMPCSIGLPICIAQLPVYKGDFSLTLDSVYDQFLSGSVTPQKYFRGFSISPSQLHSTNLHIAIRLRLSCG